jgi:hypothetical protein
MYVSYWVMLLTAQQSTQSCPDASASHFAAVSVPPS